MENQHNNQWYESLARDLKSGAKAPDTPSAAAVPMEAPAADLTDDFANDGFVDTVETPVEPETPKKTKKKKKSDPLTNIILVVAICVFLGSAGFLVYRFVVEPMLLESSMSDTQDAHKNEGTNSAEDGIWKDNNTVSEERNADGILVSFESDLAKNSETVGHISVPNTPIDYPVVQHSDNQYYLTHTFENEYNAAGCPFLDCKNVVGPNGQLSKCSIIYGHHRRNGTMFAKLKYYDDVEFYKENPVITFNTIYDLNNWVVFADFRATTNSNTGKIFDYMKYDFDDDESFMNFVTAIRKRSYFNTPVEVDANDQILLLSTCSYEKSNWRMVIAARKVREGEAVDGIDVRTAEKNTAVLMP